MAETAKTFEAEHITDQLRQLSHSDMERLSVEKKTELITAINSKLEALKKDKKNGNIAKAGTELRQILSDIRRLDLKKDIDANATVQETKTQLAALESLETSLNDSDRAREAMGKMKISDDSPEGTDMEPGEILNAQKGWDISKALNGIDLSKVTQENLGSLLNIVENISNTRYDLVYKEGGKIDSITKEEGGPEKYLNIYLEFKDTIARLRNEADTQALKAIDLRGVQEDSNIGDKVAAQGLDTVNYDYELKDGVLTRTNKISKLTDYRNDVDNKWESLKQREVRLAQEKMKAEEPGNIQKVLDGYHGSGDIIDATKYGLDPTYSYNKTEQTITRTKDEKTDTWNIDEQKWETETEVLARVSQENETKEGTDEYREKIRTIFEEMKSRPDVYQTEYGGTYEFNGQQLSLEGEEPNQYLTRVVDGKKEMWSSEPGVWEEIKEVNYDPKRLAFISSIGETPLPEGKWTNIDGALYFRKGETLISVGSDGKFQENIKGVWYNREFGDLPVDIQESATNNRLKYFQDIYGDYIDPEFWNGETAPFKDIPLKQISRVDDWNAGNQQSTIEGGIIINMVDSLLKSKKTSAPRMGDLTLAEYNRFQQDPDSFADSSFVGDRAVVVGYDSRGKEITKSENAGFVNPELYGIDSKGYEYARYDYSSGTMVVKRPTDTEKQGNPENILVIRDGQTMKATDYLVSNYVPRGEGIIPGTDIKYEKDKDGNITTEKEKYIATTGKWEKVSNV